MKRCTLVFSLFCCFLNLKAQTVSKTCDTCLPASVNYLKDSLIKSIRQSHTALSDSVSKELLNATDKKAQGYYKRVQSKLDSNARATFVEKSKSTVVQPLNKAKTLPGSKWEMLKSKMPKGKQLFSFSGQVRSESFATSAQNPVIRSEMVYSRLYVSPTITLLGLPFTSNFFFTTEANNTYKNNFFSIRFDAAALRQNALNQIQKELDETRKLDRLRQVDLQKYKLESDRYQQELDRLEKQVPDLKSWKDELRAEAELQAKSKLEKEKQTLEERIKNLPEEEKKRLEEAFKQKQDSVTDAYRKSAEDSFMSAKSAGKSNLDTAKVNRYLRLKAKLDHLQSKKEQINGLRQFDSAKLLEKTRGMKDPDDIKKMAQGNLPSKKLLQSVLTIDRFGIGLVNPQYSELTLYNASVKGLDIGINKSRYFYDITIGKTTRQFFSPFANTLPDYDRYIGVSRLGLGELKGDYLAMEYLYAFDKDIVNSQQPLVKNGVFNISGRFTFLKNLTVEANAAQSFYRESFLNTENLSINPVNQKQMGAEMNRAFNVKGTQKLGENAKLEASIKQTGAGFRTVGNPFLRRNFREAEFKYEQQFFKKKLKASGFYKEMRDNLYEINLATNRLKGYGLKVSTAFEKLPNLTLSYSPYQQGNNHPDSLYRSNTQFSITTAMLTYKKRWKTINWNGLLNFTRSAMEIGNKGTVEYRLISTVHSVQFTQRHSIVLSWLNNSTGPSVDSLNSNSIQTTYTYMATKRLSFGTIGEYTQYKNGAFRAGGGLQISSNVFNNFSLSLMGRYDRVDGLWNLKDEDVFSGRLIAAWRW